MGEKKLFKAVRHYPRLDHFLKECLPDISRTQIEKFIGQNQVQLNEQVITRKSREIVPGDRVLIEFPTPVIVVYHPSRELIKLYEDEYLIIIDKPAGLSVHPGAGEKGETIFDIFTYYYPQVKDIKNTDRPGIVHRLDKDTTGVLLLAKDAHTQKRLQKQFKRREIEKAYLTLVSGHLSHRTGTIDAPIMRSHRNRTKFVVPRDTENTEARDAVTAFTVIREFSQTTLVKLFPQTGRTHQLRVHLAHYGHPVLGDRVYGKAASFVSLALHAFSIAFTHPVTAEPIYCRSPLPVHFLDHIASQVNAAKS